jgi:transposase InsO family protein
MNHHKNARLTFARRLEMVRLMTEHRLTPADAAAAAGVSEPTARKWLGRFLVGGEPALVDASSRPRRSPNRISQSKALAIVELRRRRLTQARIAGSLDVSEATVSRVLRRAGLSKLATLQPVEPVQRYEHAAPGDLLHIDTKKLGVIMREGHRIHGDRTKRARGHGWEMLFVAIDDHARIAFTQMHPDECGGSAVEFLRAAVAYYATLGITVRRVLTDNGSPFKAHAWRDTCVELGIAHKRTRAYRPQTNGKAERFIQSALREWAYGIAYDNSSQRTAMLAKWQHHYNWHRPHAGIGGVPPMSRLKPASTNNVLTLHT